MIKYDSIKKIVYDDAKQDPGNSVWGGDFTKVYGMFTPGTQNSTDGGNWNTPAPEAYITRSNAYSRLPGGASYKAVVTKSSKSTSNLKWCRAEVMWQVPEQQISQNKWRFAAFSTLIDPSWEFDSVPCQIGYDCKSVPEGPKTPFWLGILNDDYYIEGQFNGLNSRKLIGKVKKGVWEDWVIEANWSSGSDGWFKFYCNQKLIHQANGANIYSGGGSHPRLQMGLYKWPWGASDGQGWGAGNGKPIVMYFGEFKVGMVGGTAILQDFFISNTTTPPVEPPPVVVPPIVVPPTPGNKPKFTTPIADVETIPATTQIKVFAQHGGETGFIQSFSIEQVSGPVSATVTQFDQSGWKPTETNFKFENLINGDYEFKVTAKDNLNQIVTDNFKIKKKSAEVPDTTNYYVSSVESTETVNGKTYKSIIISWKDGSKTELYKKP